MLLSEAIKLIRKKMLMSQEDFAAYICVSVATINRWENGRNTPNINAMRKIRRFCLDNNLSFEDIEKEWLSHSQEGNK